MTPLEASLTQQTAIRHLLLKNGYSPIPTYGKRALLKGWPTVQIDETAISSWHRATKWPTTGLRLDNGLVVIDIDIEDADLAAKAYDVVHGVVPGIDSAPERGTTIGSKKAYLFRLPEGSRPFGRYVTTAHVKPGQDPDDDMTSSHFVEMYGGGSSRHFACYGPHSFDDVTKEVIKTYVWSTDADGNDFDPTVVPLDELPTVTEEQIEQVYVELCAMFAQEGWPRRTASKHGKTDTAHSYIITDDMRFDCLDGVSRSFDELEAYYHESHDPRCSAAWLEGSGARNRTRCRVHMHGNEVVIFETQSHTHFHHVGAVREDNQTKAQKLADALRLQGEDLDALVPDATDEFKAALHDLVENWAFAADRSGRECMPIYAPEEKSTSVKNLRLYYIGKCATKEGPRGGVVTINPVDVWLKSALRKDDIDGYRFLPGKPAGVVEFEGAKVINSFTPTVHVHGPDADLAALFDEFIEHLVPHPEERAWFIQWMAHKVQNPGIPAVAVLHVDPRGGTGKGALGDMLGRVIGHYASVGVDKLLGGNTQSQYNDWLNNRLLIVIEEVLSGGDGASKMAWKREQEYEKIKPYLDPRPRTMMITRKGLPNTPAHVVASFYMSTNSLNALPLTKNDRRVAVIRGATTTIEKHPLKQRLFGNPDVVKPGGAGYTDEFISAIYHRLKDVDVSAFNPFDAPDWGGKETMRLENLNELDHLIEEVSDGWPHDWADITAFADEVMKRAARRGLDQEFRSIRRAASDFLRANWAGADGSKRLNVETGGKAKCTAYFRTADAFRRVDQLPLEQRRKELDDQRNGVTSAAALGRKLGLHVVDDT